MKRNLLFLILALGLFFPLNAQYPIYYETFMSGALPAGWETIETPGATGHWKLVQNGATYNLYCQESENGGILNPDPVKREIIMTHEFDLPTNDVYGLRIPWAANQVYLLEREAYDFKVGVTVDNGETWDILWSASVQEDVERSGVIFPWAHFQPNYSTISLKDYSGVKMRIGFIYDLIIPKDGSSVRIHEVMILPHTPIEGPIVGGTTSYTFEDSYLGVKEKSSQSLYLTNIGSGKLTVTGIEGLEGTDFSTDLVPGDHISVPAQNSYEYYVYYTPTVDGAREAIMTIKTNGGDFNVKLSGTKKGLDSGYTLESFEGYQYPPVGWRLNSGESWALSSNASSGEKAISAFLVNEATITSPLLDLSSGSDHYVTFDYAISYNGDQYPENEFYLQLSTNGGVTFTTTLWTERTYLSSGYQRITVPISGNSSNCMLRWVYKLDTSAGFDTDCNTIYIDNIVLPPLANTQSKPVAATNPSPVNGSNNQEVNELNLTWYGALHADGYKLYVGKDAANPSSIINGEVIAQDEKYLYELNGLDYNTTYYWKVVPYNTYGDADGVEVWNFTTMEDQSISQFPYFYGFEEDEFPGLGWRVINKEGIPRGWDRTEYGAYSGKYSALVNVTRDDAYSILQMPEIRVPEDQDLQITFVWGNAAPVGLSKAPNKVDAVRGDSLYFEIKTADSEWETVLYCSQDKSERNWKKEKVVLGSEYRGKRVTARWRQNVNRYVNAGGGALDDVEVTYLNEGGVPVVSYKEWYRGQNVVRKTWNAGIANYMQTILPGEIFNLANEGEADLQVESVHFHTKFFETTLAKDVVIEANNSINFGLAFTALEYQPEILDSLFITFTDGQVYKFPIVASAMGQSSYCYTFEDAPAFAMYDILDFKLVDQDGMPTIPYEGIFFTGKGSSYAFIVMDWEAASWNIINPRSGKKALLASGPTSDNIGRETNDWLISKQLQALEGAQMRFYAKSLADDADGWELHKLTVLVSTTDNQISSFTALPSFTSVKIPKFSDYAEYQECVVDLSQYAGQDIYVAILHQTSYGLGLVLDDVYFENFVFSTDLTNKPIFMSEPIKQGTVGELYSYNITVRDFDEDQLTLTVTQKPDWLSYNETENIAGRIKATLSGTPATKGTYSIRMEVTDGENVVSHNYDLVVSDADLVEENVTGITIYPNPATEFIYIDGTYEGKVILTDLAGKIVYTDVNVKEIPVRNLPSGIYILKIYTEGGVYTQTIIRN